MHFKITTLVENAVPIMGDRKLIGEHGLSFLIETRGHRLLFDTGQYLALENNTATRKASGGSVSKSDADQAW